MTSRQAQGSEYELVLIVRSSSPGTVLDRIGSTKTVGRYQLIAAGEEKLHDTYFDTEDQSLSRHRLNLRLRAIGSQWRVTLKKSPGLFSRNRNKRNETELEWSLENWSQVSSEMLRHGVTLKNHRSTPNGTSPIRTLLEFGLRIIQDRETLRRTRGIVSSHGERLAELALDSVTYHFPEKNVTLDELEFESKSKLGNSELAHITKTFEQTFAPDLERWRMGKLRTGSAIKRALESGRLEGLVTSDGRLQPSAYDLIARG